jgi:hypothetical protein
VLVLRVLPFVLAATLKNRVRHQIRRLRQPRYAIATVVGLAWFWFYAGRHLVAGPMKVPTMPLEVAPLAGIGLAAGGTLVLLLGWILRAKHQALAMNEAEVQFLFPAPLTRVQVLHYRVLQLVALGFVGTLFTTLLFSRAASGRPVLFALGAWVAFAVVDLHRLGVALTWAAVGEGWSGLRRRAGTFALLLGALAFTGWAATQVVVPELQNLSGWAIDLSRAVLDSPLRWALWPGLTLAGLVLARTPAEFLSHLPGSLALLVVHYLWVVRSGVAFEEAALAAAERRARTREAMRRRSGGMSGRRGPRTPPFRLGPSGRVEVAFVWKALIATGWGRLAGRWGLLAVVVSLGSAAWLASPAGQGAAKGVGPMAVALWGFAVVFSGSVIRADLRLDRQNLDVLRALPVSGATVVRGEILGAAAHVVAAQWLILPVAATASRWAGPPGARLWMVAAAAVLGPAVSLVNLVLQNAVVVALPGWTPREGERAGGPEAAGMRIVVAIGGLLALSLVVLPAAAAAALLLGAWWAVAGTVTPPVAALAAWVAAAVLVAESWIAARLLGAAFDRFDPSEG